jgi:alanine racemase
MYDRPVVRPTVARIDLRALQSNYRRLVEHVTVEARERTPGVIAVVKANAYGHGAAQVAHALEDAGADLLACADIEEGAALRNAGVRAPVLVFGALSVSQLDGLFDCRLIPTISTPGAARAVQAAAARYRQQLRYHLKIDTGMNRLGFRHDNVTRTLPELLASPNLELDAIYTHFATADDPESTLFAEQRARFERALAAIDALMPRHRQRFGGRGAVLIRGRRVPIVGAVSMDMLAADVTGLDVETGDEVVIIGSQGADRIDVREMAAQIGTIPYEILCRIGSRIERVYDEGSSPPARGARD